MNKNRKEYYKNYRLNHKEQYREYSKKYRENNLTTYEKLKKENKELHNKIDKAIAYIEQLEHSEWVSFGKKIILEILKDSDVND